MECFCGCGKEISGAKPTQRNFTAASVALELLAWDKNRAFPTPGPEGREGLIARGADCYQRLLYSLHEQGGGDPDADCEEWLRESAEMRLQRPDMNKRQFLSRGPAGPNLSEHDMAEMDRLRPELSFTGKAPEDLLDKLERLRALREDGTLTEEEFAAAKARLLTAGHET